MGVVIGEDVLENMRRERAALNHERIDALVAEKIMGLEPWPGRPGAFRAPVVPAGAEPKPCLPPSYSTDIAAAWRIVEKMRADWTAATAGVDPLGRAPIKAPFDDGMFFGELKSRADRRWPWAFFYVTPLSICICALQAYGVDVDENDIE